LKKSAWKGIDEFIAEEKSAASECFECFLHRIVPSYTCPAEEFLLLLLEVSGGFDDPVIGIQTTEPPEVP
jgi:hypothetical protein